MIRRLRTAATATLLSTTTVLLSATPPAQALLSPYLEVNVALVSGGFQVCARGAADPRLVAVSHWEYAVAGARESAANPTIFVSAARDGSTFPLLCVNVLKLGAPEGQFTATLTLVSDGLDVARSTPGGGFWNAAFGDQPISTSTCGGPSCLVTTRLS